MQIYSLTLERLERLKKQIADKKAEKDELEALDEKDLWCRDLDAFAEEWENQMRLDDEIRSNIRKMGRRVSKKIGAGKGGKRSKNDDDDFNPTAKKSKAVAKPLAKKLPTLPKTTTQQRFASQFSKPTKAPTPGIDGTADSDDDDFMESLGKGPQKSRPARAKKPAILLDLSDEDDDDFASLEPEAKPEPAKAPSKKPSSAEISDDDDEDFAALSKPKAESKTAPTKKPTPTDLSDEEDEDSFVAPSKSNSKAKAAPAKKPSPVVNLSEDEDVDSFVVPSKSNSKAKAAPAKKPSPVINLSDDEDEDFAALSKPKGKARAAPAKKPSPAESEPESEPEPEVVEAKPANGRSKRAAASKAKKWAFDDSDEESESDGDNMIGDVGALVRGIGEPAADATNGRLSLFAMSRSEHGNAAIPKLKTKQSRTNFDLDSPDDTNYELLAKSSPQKPTRSSDIDELMSDDDDAPVAAKASSKAKQGKAPLNVVSAGAAKTGRSRPAGSKSTKTKDNLKPSKQSPAAKAYAAKKSSSAAASKGKKNTFDFSDEEDDDGDVRTGDSPPAPAPRARGRPGRAAAAKKKTYALPSEDEEMSDADVYAMDDSD